MIVPAHFLCIYLLSCAAALLLGGICGYRIVRRQYIKQKVAQLSNPPQASTVTKALDHQLRDIRRTLNDTHKRVLAISKGIKLTPR
jgi:uncharacterized protein YneF (UPF0154 family)